MNTKNYFVTRCLELAKLAAEKGNNPVGAVIVKLVQ